MYKLWQNLNLDLMLQNPLVFFDNILKKLKKGKWAIEIVEDGLYLKSNFAHQDREIIGIFELAEDVVSFHIDSLEDGNYCKTKNKISTNINIIKQYKEIENNIIAYFRNNN